MELLLVLVGIVIGGTLHHGMTCKDPANEGIDPRILKLRDKMEARRARIGKLNEYYDSTKKES